MKKINIKNQTFFFFFNDMISITNFYRKLLKIDKKSHKNIDIYYIGYIIMKDSDYVNINSLNFLYLIISEVGEYLEGKNGNK